MTLDFPGSGIYVLGAQGGVVLNKILAANNGRAGIILDHVGGPYVQRSILSQNYSVDREFGDGLIVFSSPVITSNTLMFQNDRSGAFYAGCTNATRNGPFAAGLKSNEFRDNQIDFGFDYLSNCTLPTDEPGTFNDLGGNGCIFAGVPRSCKATPSPS